MAMFNLDSYETVDDRLARLHADPRFSDVRIVTINHTTPTDRAEKTWIVECRIYLNSDDQINDLPLATGWAFEIDGVGMANKTSALENAETSSRGRAMQALAMSGAKKGPSRTEMEKVARGSVSKDWIAEASALDSVDKLRELWQQARQAGASDEVLVVIKDRADGLSTKEDSVGSDKTTK